MPYVVLGIKCAENNYSTRFRNNPI